MPYLPNPPNQKTMPAALGFGGKNGVDGIVTVTELIIQIRRGYQLHLKALSLVSGKC